MPDPIEERARKLADVADERMSVHGTALDASTIVRALRAERRATLNEVRQAVLAARGDYYEVLDWIENQMRECEEGEVQSG